MKRFLFLLLLFLTGCSLFINKPDVAVKNVTLTGVDGKGVWIEIILSVANPNSYRLTLSKYSYDLYVSSLPLTKGENANTIEFPGKEVTEVRLPARVEFRDLLKVMKAVSDPEKVPYRLIAAFNIHAPMGSITVPVDRMGTFALPKDALIGGILKHIK